jgi:hypothetical protein
MANKLLISEVAYARTKKVEVDTSLDVSAPLLGIDGKIVDMDARNPIHKITVEGEGSKDAALVTGAGLTISVITGGVTLIDQVDEDETNEGKDPSWKVSAINAPSASSGA